MKFGRNKFDPRLDNPDEAACKCYPFGLTEPEIQAWYERVSLYMAARGAQFTEEAPQWQDSTSVER